MKCKYCGKEDKNEYGLMQHQEYWCKLNPDEKVQKRLKNQSDKSKENGSGKKLGKLRKNIIKIKCTDCGHEIDKNQFNKHKNSKSCLRNQNNRSDRKSNEKCIYCNITPRYSIEKHLQICRKNPDNKKDNEWSDERRKCHSESMKKAVKNNPDSYAKNNVCGRVKIIEYNGIKLKGKWELKTAQWLDSKNIKWESEINPQNYYWNNSWHLYFPDFYLPEYDVYIEVKGFKRDRDEAKWSHFKGILIIIDNTIINDLEKFGTVAQLVEQRAYTS